MTLGGFQPLSPKRLKDLSKKHEKDIDNAANTLLKRLEPQFSSQTFDDKSPFVTSGIRLGSGAITSRGVNEKEIVSVVNLIDEALMNAGNDAKLAAIGQKVNSLMVGKPLFATPVIG